MQDLVTQLALLAFAYRRKIVGVTYLTMALACGFSEVLRAWTPRDALWGWFAYRVNGYITNTAQGKTTYEGVNTLFCCKTVATMAPPATPVLTF